MEIFNASRQKNTEINNLLQKIKYEVGNLSRGEKYVFLPIIIIKDGQPTYPIDQALLQEVRDMGAIELDKRSIEEMNETLEETELKGLIIEGVWIKPIEPKFSRLCEKYQKSITTTDTITALNTPRLITRDSNGDYFYDGKRIEMGQETIYYKVFDILYTMGDQRGFVSHEEIDRELIKRGLPESRDEKAKYKRIHNATLNEQQGLFRYAKVSGKKLRNETKDGRKLIELLGKGLKLNNPTI